MLEISGLSKATARKLMSAHITTKQKLKSIIQKSIPDPTTTLDKNKNPKVTIIVDGQQITLPSDVVLHTLYDVLPINRQTITNLSKYFPKSWVIAGSYRRGQPISQDIDIVCANYLEAKEFLYSHQSPITWQVVGCLKDGSQQGSFLLQIHPGINGNSLESTRKPEEISNGSVVQIDIFASDNIPVALMHYTGSKMFNIKTRAAAKKKGYKINQYGVFATKTNKKMDIRSEKDIFDLLGIKYLQPHERI